MNVVQRFQHIAAQYPESNPKLTELPTGVVMLDFTVRGVRYCAENIPSHNAFGLSQIEGTSPFHEGVDESFSSAEQLEAKIVEMMQEKE